MANPRFELEPVVAPPARPAAPWPADAPPPRLPRAARRFATRVSRAHDDADLLIRWPAAVVRMTEVVEAALLGCPGAEPRRQAVAAVAALLACWEGERFRVPDPREVLRVLRDAEIWRNFDGRNVAELAARYGMHQIAVYKVLRRQRELHRQRRIAQRGGA